MNKNRSVETHRFAMVPRPEVPRSQFRIQSTHKTTFDAGFLVPIYVDEVLPGDTFNLKMAAFARLATPLYPVMDNMHLDTFFFFVPYRLVWANFVRMMGERPVPEASVDFTVPQTVSPAGGYTIGSLQDYMGLPTVGQVDPTKTVSHSSLPLRAYNLVFNEWFRDQNLQSPRTIFNLGDGPDDYTEFVMERRGKRHDYFTSCLPWPQKGEAVNIPLGGNAPVIGLGMAENGPYSNIGAIKETGGGSPTYTLGVKVGSNGTSNTTFGVREDPDNPGFPGIFADLSEATAATINSLRQAFQIQTIFERDARGGTRYTELIKSHFGVTSPDARLQRPEYLGGGSTPVNISPIPQTSPTGTYANTPQGNLAAIGTAQIHNHGFTTSFTEHCIVIGLVSVRADLTYQQGLNRMWSRKTRFDFYWPALSHIGEQAVLQKEIFCDGVPANDDKVFGYQERYAEYRYKPSMITGEFRSSFAQSLDSWHLSQDFATAPVLDAAFIEENPPVDRVIAVTSEPHFLFDSYIQIKAARPMPVYGVPGLIDHF